MPDLLSVKRLQKKIANHAGLEEVNLMVSPGEVVVVASRSEVRRKVLMRILAGAEQADSGDIYWKGERVKWMREQEAQQAGIWRLNEVADPEERTRVAAWVWKGREPRKWGFKQKSRMRLATEQMLNLWDLKIPVRSRMRDLASAQRQWLALMRGVMMCSSMLLIEEGMLNWNELDERRLHQVFASLKKDGIAVVIESGTLQGLSHLADRAVVLRDGRNVAQLFKYELDDEMELLRLMGGPNSELVLNHQRVPRKKGWVVLDVQALRTRHFPERMFGFDLSQGELVGLAGHENSGKRMVFQILCGEEQPAKGTLLVGGEKSRLKSPAVAMKSGFVMWPADERLRQKYLDHIQALKRQPERGIWLHGSMAKTELERLAQLLCWRGDLGRFGIRESTSPVGEQSRWLERWLALGPGVLLLEDPTLGMDGLAKREVYQLLEKLAQCGMAILWLSSDLHELTQVMDRVLVMHEGDLMGVLQGDRISKEAIQTLADGTQRGLPRLRV